MSGIARLAAVVFAPVLASASAFAGEDDAQRLAPFAFPRASFFHAALEVPPLLPANQLEAGDVVVRLGSYHTRSDTERTEDDEAINFDGLYHDWLSLEGTWGVSERVELSARVALSGWDEHLDRLEVFDAAGDSVVRDETATILGTGKTARGVSVSDVTLYARWQALRDRTSGRDVSLALGVKLPLGQPQDLNSAGTIDVALAGYFGAPLLGGHFTGAAGIVFPTTDQNLFVRDADVGLDPFLHFAAGVVWPLGETWAAGVQLEANTSAFGDLAVLDGAPVTVLFGVRKSFGAFGVELGAGTGFDWDTSYQYQASLALTYRFD